jgi:hypothetical protein
MGNERLTLRLENTCNVCHCLNDSYVIYGRLSICGGVVTIDQVCIWVLAVVFYVLIQKLPEGSEKTQEN